MIKKEMYAAPATEVLELRLEGTVLTGSIDNGLSFSLGSTFNDEDETVGVDW